MLILADAFFGMLRTVASESDCPKHGLTVASQMLNLADANFAADAI